MIVEFTEIVDVEFCEERGRLVTDFKSTSIEVVLLLVDAETADVDFDVTSTEDWLSAEAELIVPTIV